MIGGLALTPFDAAAILIVLAAALGYVNFRFLKLPPSIGLTIMGAVASLIVVALDRAFPGAGIGHDVVGFIDGIDFHTTLMDGMLSFLLFAGALHVDWREMARGRWTILVLSTIGVVLSTLLVGAGFLLLTRLVGFGLPAIWCFVFGALVSPTDPVSVMGVLKRADVSPALEATVAGESLFNDGVGVVIFAILLASAVSGAPFSPLHGAKLFAVEAGGGVLLGLAIGGIAFRAMRSIDDYKVEVLISLAVVMGGYAIARPLHASGPVAMAVAGLIIGNAGVAHAMSDTTRDYLHKFWDLIDDILNTVLFLLIGLEVVTIPGDLRLLVLGVAAIPLALAARGVGGAAVARDPADASLRPGRAGHADLGRPARRHLGRARARPARRTGARGDPGGDLCRRAVLRHRPGRDDQARAGICDIPRGDPVRAWRVPPIAASTGGSPRRYVRGGNACHPGRQDLSRTEPERVGSWLTPNAPTLCARYAKAGFRSRNAMSRCVDRQWRATSPSHERYDRDAVGCFFGARPTWSHHLRRSGCGGTLAGAGQQQTDRGTVRLVQRRDELRAGGTRNLSCRRHAGGDADRAARLVRAGRGRRARHPPRRVREAIMKNLSHRSPSAPRTGVEARTNPHPGSWAATHDPRWPAVAACLAALRENGRFAVRIVDADCGAGSLLLHAAQQARVLGFTAIEARGIDGSPALVGRARAAASSIADPAIGLVFEVVDMVEALRQEHDLPADIVLWHGARAEDTHPDFLAALVAAGDLIVDDARSFQPQRAAA